MSRGFGDIQIGKVGEERISLNPAKEGYRLRRGQVATRRGRGSLLA